MMATIKVYRMHSMRVIQEVMYVQSKFKQGVRARRAGAGYAFDNIRFCTVP